MVRLVDLKDELDYEEDHNPDSIYVDDKKGVISLGQRAIESIDDALDQFDSARNWGLFDMFGGGFFSSMIKHSKIEEGQRLMKKAARDIKTFAEAVGSNGFRISSDVEVDGFLKFADMWFDNFFADIFVQDKINKARNKLEDIRDDIEDILERIGEDI